MRFWRLSAVLLLIAICGISFGADNGQNNVVQNIKNGAPGIYGFVSNRPAHYQNGGIKSVFYIPPISTKPTSRPLLIFFHGATDDPNTYQDISGLDQWASSKGFTLLSVQNCWCYMTDDHYDTATAILDSADATVELVNYLASLRAFDTRRIYVTGFSGGGFAAVCTAFYRPDIFTGLGDFKGNFYRDIFESVVTSSDSLRSLKGQNRFQQSIKSLRIYMAVGGENDRPRIIKQMPEAKSYFEGMLGLQPFYKRYPDEGHWISDRNFEDFWGVMNR